MVRFEFEVVANDQHEGDTKWLGKCFDSSSLTDGELHCSRPLGTLSVRPSNSTAGKILGTVGPPVAKPDQPSTSALFLVVNGPFAHGAGIVREKTAFAGRLQCQTPDGMIITVDRLSHRQRSARLVYAFTHVAEIRFDRPKQIEEFDAASTTLFRTLSLMRGRWVGIVGPWLFLGDAVHTVIPGVTKTSRHGNSPTWSHETLLGAFEELFTRLTAGHQDSEMDTALQTALHWLIESQVCAGGVEGSLILQQAALETLAWFVIVQRRKLCSTDGFDKLPAADKMRWLLSLYSIPTLIPAHRVELVSYAKAYNLDDLPAILADVRNALVHGSQKKVERLFHRRDGNEERTHLWYLIGGLLEQAILAVLSWSNTEARFGRAMGNVSGQRCALGTARRAWSGSKLTPCAIAAGRLGLRLWRPRTRVWTRSEYREDGPSVPYLVFVVQVLRQLQRFSLRKTS